MVNKVKAYFSPTTLYLIFITLIGAILRLFAYQYNDIPHGDINLDYAAGLSFLRTGELTLPLISARPYLEAQLENGIPLDQHAPLWAMMGGWSARFIGDVFTAFKLHSLCVGIIIIPISHLVFSRAFG